MTCEISVKQRADYRSMGDWMVLKDGKPVAYFHHDEEHKANGFARRLLDGCGQPEGGVQPLG